MKHLDPTDLPSDKNGSLGRLRTVLLSAYNNSRDVPTKRALLLKTLKFVVTHIEHGIRTDEAERVEKAKSQSEKNQDKITSTK